MPYLAPPEGRAAGLKIEHWGNARSVADEIVYVLHALKRWRPDALLGQLFSVGTYALSRASALPLAVMGGANWLFPISSPRATLVGEPPSAAELRRDAERQWRHDQMVERINLALGLLRLPPLGVAAESPLQGDCFLLRSWPELQGAEPLPSRVHLVGPCVEPWFEAAPELKQWLSRPSPRSGLIHVQPGRSRRRAFCRHCCTQ